MKRNVVNFVLHLVRNVKKQNEYYIHFFLSIESKKDCPQCLPECELIQYTIQSSYADYPNTRSADNVLKRVEKHLIGTRNSSTQSDISNCSNTSKRSLLDDIVAVEISASPYATEILAESPMYTWVDLISSIGGQTGYRNNSSFFFNIICHCV